MLTNANKSAPDLSNPDPEEFLDIIIKNYNCDAPPQNVWSLAEVIEKAKGNLSHKNTSHNKLKKDVDDLIKYKYNYGAHENMGFGDYKIFKSWRDAHEAGGHYEYQKRLEQNNISQTTMDEKIIAFQELQRELSEALLIKAKLEIKVAELSLIKKPNWRERNWFWIAAVTLVIGWFGDIGKEAVKHKIWPDQKEIKTQTPKTKDSTG